MCATLSVPFSSGRWVKLIDYLGAEDSAYVPFSPLFVGSMGETERAGGSSRVISSLSVPFSSGRWVKRITSCPTGGRSMVFQSPFRRVDG